MNESNKSDFWTLFGWCLAWIGFGACCLMAHHDEKAPLVQINFGAAPVEHSPGIRHK